MTVWSQHWVIETTVSKLSEFLLFGIWPAVSVDCFVTSFQCCCFKGAWWKLWTITIKKPLNEEQAFLSRAARYWKIHCDMRAFLQIPVWKEIIFEEWLRWFRRGVHCIEQLTNQSRPLLCLIHWIKSCHIRLTSVIDLSWKIRTVQVLLYKV